MKRYISVNSEQIYNYRKKNNMKELINYKEVISIENLRDGLARTKNNVSPGIDGIIKKEISDKRLIKLHSELAEQYYKPKPSKRVSIPKPGGGTRYLGIASQIDKVVQGALINKLEPILEKVFLNVSYGFRPGIGCHNALKEIKYSWKGVTWLINIDIVKCFDKINHDILLDLLKKYCDQSTIELIRKLLKVGYVDLHNLADRSEYSQEGTPQGSLISPILCNVILHELDHFIVSELLPMYNKGKSRPKNSNYSKRYSLNEIDKEILKRYPSLKKSLERVKHNEFVTGKKFEASDAFDDEFRRLHYIRYADDFLIGFTGPRREAVEIQDKIIEKLSTLKLEINQEKSKISHSNDLNISYLGVYLRYFKHNMVKKRAEGMSTDEVTKQTHHLQAQAINTVHFRAPIDKMLKKLVDKGLAKYRKDKTVRGTAFIKYSMFEDEQIVTRFSAIIRGINNYYSCINRRSDLWKVFAVLRKTCALTIAHKHKINSAARVYAKYGPNLAISKMGKKVTSLFYPKSLKTKIDFKTRKGDLLQYHSVMDLEIDAVKGSHKYNIKTSEVCQFEDCEIAENLEAHHINPIANLSKRKDLSAFEKALIGRKRKTVMLCKKHHNLLHNKGVLFKEIQ
jgi:group II intron reverse transcriptase/maturase